MNEAGIINISGISESRCAPVISHIVKEERQSIVITASAGRAERLASDLSFFSRKEILVMPAEEQVFLRYEVKSQERLIGRLKALKELRAGKECVVVAPVSAVLKKMPPHRVFDSLSLKIASGGETDPATLRETLVKLGYERTDMVEGPGQFSVRGGIIDVFAPGSDDPYRIELFDTKVDSLRLLDRNTQRSARNLTYIEIPPAEHMPADKEVFQQAGKRLYREYTARIKALAKKGGEFSETASRLEKRRDELCEYIGGMTNLQVLENYLRYFYEDTEYLWDYMDGGKVIVDDPERICEFLDTMGAEIRNDFEAMLERGEVIPKDIGIFPGSEDFFRVYGRRGVYVLTPFTKRIKGADTLAGAYAVRSRQMVTFNGKMDILESELKNYAKKNYKITIIASAKEKLDNLREFVGRAGICGNILFKEGALTEGMDFPDEKVCYICENDIFPGQKIARRRRKKTAPGKMKPFADISKGDYVVHENHGIGRFLGIEPLTVQGEKKDYLKIKYAGNDLLYVPVEQMDIVQKYIGMDSASPRLNTLSGCEWKMAKAKAKAAVSEMAEGLLDLYAKRKIKEGYAFEKDSAWQREFEDSFPYAETEDQLRCIEEIKKDMEKPSAMDRLLCGDVGFGKTEVAARAIFKCVTDGKQAAILVPTTILADQHYYTLKERFENFGLNVEMLSRFRTEKQQEQIIKKLKKGQIDLIIGTHRLLSKDVVFRDLGLLVIDEEHRFGVAHKEKIRSLKENIDVLTLSATPIPRTLNMSLTGIKDISVIKDPPDDRYPVQTYVLEQDDALIKDIIERELDRGGQVFVVFNRVRGILKIAEKIRGFVPWARVAVGHGQMNEGDLENVMLDFVNGETDVLVSTTIIESGIDISNANTMIVIDAENFGLSQLYQLRGRVGRSNRTSYAYLMYKKDKVLSEMAEKKLKAIKEFTEFGSGFRVAMRDLEIRGAGNLLGREQSGHIMNIGYELYCRLIDDAVRTLRGETVSADKEETSVEIVCRANIPDFYISSETQKLQMYKRIAEIRTEEDKDDVTGELIDRFGEIPRETLNLITISRIRSLAGETGAVRIYEQHGGIVVVFGENDPPGPYALLAVNEAFGMKALVYGGIQPHIRITVKPHEKLKDCERLLEILKKEKNKKPGRQGPG